MRGKAAEAEEAGYRGEPGKDAAALRELFGEDAQLSAPEVRENRVDGEFQTKQ